MGGRRHKAEEVDQLRAFVSQGLTSREIAQRLGRTEAAIRNLRHRERVIRQAQDETKALLRHRDELREAVSVLQEQQQTLSRDAEKLRLEKETLQTAINIDKFFLQQILTQALTNLKQQRPDLFVLTETDMVAALTKMVLDAICS